MINLMDLWLPILLSAVAVFVLSSLVHMVFKWHNPDYRPFANEDEVRAAIQKTNPAPGMYGLPHCLDMKQLRTPEFQKKFTDGPVGFVFLRARGLPGMGPQLGMWFVYTLAVGIFAAYLGSRFLPGGSTFAAVLRLTATVAFLTYSGGSVQNGIWMGKPWGSVAKEVLDGAIYGLATGAVFGLLWPH
jgi:hypothetical protein